MLTADDRLMLIPNHSRGRLLPAELFPGFPHLVALVPPDRQGTVAELISGTHDTGVLGIFPCDAGCVEKAFRARLALIKGYIEAGMPVVFCCQTKRDKAEARRRLTAIGPANYAIRD